MSKAEKSFELAIKDAEDLLTRFDNENNSKVERNPESLKRAGMVMALAAWETYVKDRFEEEVETLLLAVNGSLLGNFVQRRIAV
jgi:HEPN superfamily RiboL-PSP-like protein